MVAPWLKKPEVPLFDAIDFWFSSLFRNAFSARLDLRRESEEKKARKKKKIENKQTIMMT